MMQWFSVLKRKLKRQAGGLQSLNVDHDPQTFATETSPTATNGIALPTPFPNSHPPTIQAASSDIWADAYKDFTKREPKLADDYNTHLATISRSGSVSQVEFASPDWAKLIVEQLQKTREDKQWHVTFHGKDICFRAQAERLIKVLVWCNGIVKDALSAQPYAALAWSGVSILLPLLTSATVQHDAMLSHFDDIVHIQIYWKAYQDAFPDGFDFNGHGTIRTDLVELYSHIFEYQVRVICHLSSAQLSRAWQTVAGWNDWKKKASHVNILSDHCKRRVDITQVGETQIKWNQQLQQIYESRAALQQIYEVLEEERKQQQNDYKDQRERELLADLAANHEEYKNFNPKKVENTCGWFLNNASFRSWRDSEESSLLWVSAGPGCGKSVLSRSLTDEWQLSTSAATSIVCYFFFKDGDEKRGDGANALSAVLHQLFIQDLTGKFIGHAIHRHKDYRKALTTNSFELWKILLDCATTPGAGEIVCVLDALDECKEHERNIIISKLKDFFSDAGQATRHKCRLKFFVTSRPYDTIEQSMEKFVNSSCLRIYGDDHSAAVSEDIDRVIDAKIPEMLGHLSENNRCRISDRLKGMKNRTYLWLRLTFYIIEQSPSDYSRPSDVEILLDNLPDEHSKAYEKILGQKNTRHTTKLLQLILAARRPLHVNEARYALVLATAEPPFTSHSKIEEDIWDIDSFKTMAKNSCGLLVDFHDSQLSFIHQTVREFLTERPQEGGEWKWKGSFKLSECHSTMSLSCIHYLSLSELIETRFRYSFFYYARRHWPSHYRERDQNTRVNLFIEARNLCRVRNGKVPKWALFLPRPRFNWTDLTLAAFFGITQVVHAILYEEDNDLDEGSGSYSEALSLASEEGFPAVVEMLLNTKADVNTRSGFTGATPVSAAISGDHWAVVKMLLGKRGEQIQVTKYDVLRTGFGDKDCEPEIWKLLLKFEKTDEVQIAEAEVVEKPAVSQTH